MNLPQANFEDLTARYFDDTEARLAAERLGALIRGQQHLPLANLLRDYRERAIVSPDEIKFRAATDRLMNCFSVMEIASLTGFVPDPRPTEFGAMALAILSNKQVRRYYEEFYPTRLPRLFRHRLEGNGVPLDGAGGSACTDAMMKFLDLDRRFMESLEDRVLLRLLDSFVIQNRWFSDVVDMMGRPAEFIGHLLRPPEQRDVLSTAAHELGVFMQFCFDLKALLERTQDEPLLQSAFWNHYAYWFEIIGDRLREQLGEALRKFLDWEPPANNREASEAVQLYVQQATAVLEELTASSYAKPVEDALKRLGGE